MRPSLQIVDKTIMEADLDRDGKISFEEFTKMVENTDVSMSMTLGEASHLLPSFRQRCLFQTFVFVGATPVSLALTPAASPRPGSKPVGSEFGRC